METPAVYRDSPINSQQFPSDGRVRYASSSYMYVLYARRSTGLIETQ